MLVPHTPRPEGTDCPQVNSRLPRRPGAHLQSHEGGTWPCSWDLNTREHRWAWRHPHAPSPLSLRLSAPLATAGPSSCRLKTKFPETHSHQLPPDGTTPGSGRPRGWSHTQATPSRWFWSLLLPRPGRSATPPCWCPLTLPTPLCDPF